MIDWRSLSRQILYGLLAVVLIQVDQRGLQLVFPEMYMN